MIDIIAKLPYDIIINHIIPYTYNTQSKLLTTDIIHFTETMKIIKENITTVNENISDHDTIESNYIYNVILDRLYQHVNSCYIIFGIHENFVKRLRRYFNFYKKPKNDIIKYIYNQLQYKDVNTQIKILIGLLKPSERAEFMDLYFETGKIFL
jgi:hypothetical protein